MTDVDVLLGRVGRGRFEVPLVIEAAESALAELVEAVRRVDSALGAEEVLAGLLEIADERMAEAIRRISVRHGYDPASYLLVAFGGAGGQHACAVAELLGVERILMPTDASLLSAWGLGHAVVEHFAERQILAPVEEFEPHLEEVLAELEDETRRAVEADGVPAGEVEVRRRLLMLRLLGQDATLAVDHRPGTTIEELFVGAYRDRFGYQPPARPVEVESIRVVSSSRPPAPSTVHDETHRAARPSDRRRAFVAGSWREVPVFERDDLAPGDGLDGPALVVERFSSLVVGIDWRCRVAASGGLLLRHRGDGE